MDEKCFCHFGGFQVKDAVARQQIADLEDKIAQQPGKAAFGSLVTPQEYGAVGDGITDDTAAINRALAAGNGEVYFPAGNYLIMGLVAGYGDNMDNSGLIVKSNTKIRLDPGAVIHQTGGTSSERSVIFNLNGVENVEICGGVLIGDSETHDFKASGKTDEWGHAIQIRKSKNIYVHDMLIKNTAGDGIYVGQCGTFTDNDDAHSYDVHIEKCSFDHIGRNGISMTECNRWQINDCKFNDIYRTPPMAAIDVEQEGDFGPVCANGIIRNVMATGAYACIENWTSKYELIIENAKGGNLVFIAKDASKTTMRNVDGNYLIYGNSAHLDVSDSTFWLDTETNETAFTAKFINCGIMVNKFLCGAVEMHGCTVNNMLKLYWKKGEIAAYNTKFNVIDRVAIIAGALPVRLFNCLFVLPNATTENIVEDESNTPLTVIGCSTVNNVTLSAPGAAFECAAGSVINGNSIKGFASLASNDLAAGCVNF